MLYRIRARGREFEVGQHCFVQAQLTGPDPSVVLGILYRSLWQTKLVYYL